ncbi:MAG: 2-dehydropantoate 2-reductase [Anaerolineales bacterium]|jgi:2-dehydropantoate 2-reductase
MSAESILILGTGAMACFFGARLAGAAQVTLLGTWEDGLKALQSEGIRLVGLDGSLHRVHVGVARETEACRGASLALVLVKSWQTGRAAEQLARCLRPDGLALTLQNGLGNLEILASAVGQDRAALGVTTCGATLLGPGHVRVGGMGPTYLGPHPGLDRLAGLLEAAGFEVERSDDLQGLQWGKLAVNTGINPVSALLGVPNGALLELPGLQEVLRAAVDETAAVAAARGVNMAFQDPAVETIKVAERTGENLSSMLQDIRRGAPTEIDAICGAVVREGERLGIDAPVNRALWNLVRGLAAKAERITT